MKKISIIFSIFLFHSFLLFLYIILFSTEFLYSAETGNMTVQTKVIEGIWDMFENCESRRWEGAQNWGSLCRNTFLKWGEFFSNKSIQVFSTYTVSNAMALYTKTFPLENWSSVELVRMNVYTEFPANTADLKFEPKDKNGATIEAIYFNDLPANQWTDCVWNINQSLSGYTNVRQLLFLPDNLGTNSATFYFDNLRLVMTGGTTYYWDIFDSSSSVWEYRNDGYAYDDGANRVTTESAITWTGSTSTANCGRIYMKWHKDKDGSSEAKVETLEYHDLGKYVKIKSEIKCSATTAQIAIGFWNPDIDPKWIDTGTKYVSSINTWETLEWELPSGTNNYWSNVKVIPIIKNTNEVESGEIWIDNLMFYK